MRRVKFRNIALGISAGCVALVLASFAIADLKGIPPADFAAIMRDAASRRMHRKTEAQRVEEILSRKPNLADLAQSAGGSMAILVCKKERVVELRAPGWTEPKKYRMTAFSGKLGPKLSEGDGQIPEGIYKIEYLNPNSRFHLSLKVSYPNDFDRAMAAGDGRANLGGDIMIHGNSVTIGCVPVGDDAIEDIFFLVYKIGLKNVDVVIAPYDMRKGRRPDLETADVKWYPKLCDMISAALPDTTSQDLPPSLPNSK